MSLKKICSLFIKISGDKFFGSKRVKKYTDVLKATSLLYVA